MRDRNDDPESFERACHGKERHASEAAATAALGVYKRLKEVRGGDGMVPYRCGFCDVWHLGHWRASGRARGSNPTPPAPDEAC